MIDAGPEDDPPNEHVESPDEPPTGEEPPVGEVSADGAPESVDHPEESPADAGESSGSPAGEAGPTEQADDAPVVTEDEGPKEAEFPPVDPGVDIGIEPENEEIAAETVPVRYLWSLS